MKEIIKFSLHSLERRLNFLYILRKNSSSAYFCITISLDPPPEYFITFSFLFTYLSLFLRIYIAAQSSSLVGFSDILTSILFLPDLSAKGFGFLGKSLT